MTAETEAEFNRKFQEQFNFGIIHGIDDVPYSRRRKAKRKTASAEIPRKNAKLLDWHAKEAYLLSQYPSVAPRDFYASLGFDSFASGFKICGINVKNATGARFQHYTDIDTMLKAASNRRDAYIYPASYMKSYSREQLMYSTSCLYIDLDYVRAADLERLCQHDFYGHRPTYLVNSGNGVHLVYELNESLMTYNWTKFLLKRIHRALLQAFASHNYRADLGTSLSHAYRVVGSRTKLGQVCTAYRTGNPMTVDALAASVGVHWARPVYKKHKTYQGARKANGKHSFYNYLVRSIAEETVVGHRYMSLFALTCVGYKCGLTLDSISKDVMELAQKLNLPLKEAKHALSACNPEKAVSVRSATLEGWLGRPFERKTKRNGRTRAEHLAWVANKRIAASMDKIASYLRDHIEANISEVARTLMMGRKTVAKYIGEVRAKLAEQEAVKQSEAQVEYTVDRASTVQKQEGESFIAYIPPLKGELVSVKQKVSGGEAQRRGLSTVSVVHNIKKS